MDHPIKVKQTANATEARLQAEIVAWMRNERKVPVGLFFSIPNEGTVSNRFLSTGRVAGMPDLCYLVNGTAIFFELKTSIGKVSEKQIYVHKNLLENGYSVHVVRNFDDFKQIILSIQK